MAVVKVWLEIAGDDVFYYPDVMVGCDPRDTEKFYLRHPKVIVEVLSESTERTDRREKLLSYMRIESLEAYVLVAQDKSEVTILQRGKNWQAEVLRGPEQTIQIDSLQFTLPLSALYEGVAV
jgi:Uma2 family endonuclease